MFENADGFKLSTKFLPDKVGEFSTIFLLDEDDGEGGKSVNLEERVGEFLLSSILLVKEFGSVAEFEETTILFVEVVGEFEESAILYVEVVGEFIESAILYVEVVGEFLVLAILLVGAVGEFGLSIIL